MYIYTYIFSDSLSTNIFHMYEKVNFHISYPLVNAAPYPVCDTVLDLDIPNDLVPDMLAPYLGLCWPSSTVEFEHGSPSYRNPLTCVLWPEGMNPPPPPGPHWDDAVVEISTMENWDMVPTIKRTRAWSAQEGKPANSWRLLFCNYFLFVCGCFPITCMHQNKRRNCLTLGNAQVLFIHFVVLRCLGPFDHCRR